MISFSFSLFLFFSFSLFLFLFLYFSILNKTKIQDPHDPDIATIISDILTTKVNDMINEIKDEYDLKNDFELMNGRDINGNILPLIRLRVFRGLFAAINVQRFGSQFMHKVANPKGVLFNIFFFWSPSNNFVQSDG